MSGVPSHPAKRRSTSEVLTALDGELSSIGEGVASGLYTFWLGSGISGEVVPRVHDMLRSVLAYLQERVEPTEPECPYSGALIEIFRIGGLQPDGIKAIPLDQPIDRWPDLEDLLRRLIDKYAIVLDVPVDSEPDEDFLVWDAIDVRRTYGAGSLEPDAEHLCIAILIMEGLIRDAASANWDGLIESAVDRLNGPSHPSPLRVLVRNDEFRDLPAAKCDLIKFHGCAVRAAADPRRYRSLLIARASQIARWTENQDFALALGRLTQLLATQPTLMIGLSAQDANIHNILSKAQNSLAWAWPTNPPPMVFALETLGSHQRNVLKLVFRDDYQPNRASIEESARLGVFAKPLLSGLVLFAIAQKLCTLLDGLDGPAWDAKNIQPLKQSILELRDVVGTAASADCRDFTVRLIESVTLVLGVFRTGVPPAPGATHYEPLTAQPIVDSETDRNVDTDGLRHLAVAGALLSRGAAEGLWSLSIGTAASPTDGVCSVDAGTGRSKVFIVRDTGVMSTMLADGHLSLEDPDVLAIHAKEMPQRQKRSPGLKLGRRGRRTGREMAVQPLVKSADDADDLFEQFRLEAAI